ncbi:MAG: agmatinase [Candidatus Woesearchaeota archaeon]|nr:agmatinase [Candidatus Woesearchaeota archaeon]
MKFPDNFMGLEEEQAKSYKDSKAVIMQVPFEGTVSYEKGTSKAPKVIIETSKQLEIYDEELGRETILEVGIWTDDKEIKEKTADKNVEAVYAASKKHVSENKFLAILGGEHSITTGAIKAYKEKYSKLSVLQLDAHADLRDEYTGTIYSHAAVMSRIRELCPAVQVGIRDFSRPEAEKIKKFNYPIFMAKDIYDNDKWFDKAIGKLSDDVFITFDIDVFDQSIMPATGTPVTGGLDWYMVIKFLRRVFEKKNVVGFDLVELAPMKNMHGCDYLAAKLVYKMIGYKFFAKK